MIPSPLTATSARPMEPFITILMVTYLGTSPPMRMHHLVLSGLALMPLAVLGQGDTVGHMPDDQGTFRYITGRTTIADGAVTLDLPEGYRFLGGEQAREVIIELWENPPEVAENVLGIILPPGSGIHEEEYSFSFWVQYDESGHVSDGDAHAMDHEAMLAAMFATDSLSNVQRMDAGYEPLYLVGWAAPPYYDGERKTIHWALEFETADQDEHVLNYFVRVLGRKGFLEIDAVGAMPQLDAVQQAIPTVLDFAYFNPGFRYEEFDPATDASAGRTVGGLVDGRMDEKVAEVVGMIGRIALVAVGLMLVIAVVVIWLLVRHSRRTSRSVA